MPSLQWRLLLGAHRHWSRLLPGHETPHAGPRDPYWNARCERYLPAVGVSVAALGAIVYALSGAWLPHAVAVLLALGAQALATGARHEGDARRVLFQGAPVLLLLLRYESLAALDSTWIAVALITSAAWSRGVAMTLSSRLDAQDPTPGARTTDQIVATVCAAAPIVAVIWWTDQAGVFGVSALLSCTAALIARPLLARRSHPVHSQMLGALQQFAEVAFLLALLASLTVTDETLVDPAS